MKIEIPQLAKGEKYMGLIGDPNGRVYHLIRMPGDAEPATHAEQMAWATSIGGDLPNTLEAAMLFAHAKDQFRRLDYWTNETFVYPDDPGNDTWVWSQSFRYGGQHITNENSRLRARAVRRVVVKESF